MKAFATYVAKRIAFMPVAMFIVITLSFAIVNLVPSNPAREIAGGLADDEQVAVINARLGLDKPVPERYVAYLTALARGDLGRSFYSQRPVAQEIRQYLPGTIELIVMGLLVAGAVGIVVGSVAAYFHARAADRAVRGAVTIVQSIPDFFLGLVLIFVGFYVLRVAPAPVGRLGLLDRPPPRVTGALTVDAVLAGQWATLGAVLSHALLPALTLGIFYAAYFAKTTRSAMIGAFSSRQVEFARACGLREPRVYAYAFRSVLAPIVTYGGILFASLIGGAAIVETVFAWGGIGQWAITAILKLDVPAIQGFILLAGMITLLVYLTLDVVVAALDPRVSYGARKR